MALLEVEKIACDNQAAFVMKFWIRYSDKNGNLQATDNNSGEYPVGQTRVFDMSTGNPPIPEGTEVWPAVHAVAGSTMDGNTHLIYRRNGQTATFRVTGTTQNFQVNKIG